jgi:hypothetical protein
LKNTSHEPKILPETWIFLQKSAEAGHDEGMGNFGLSVQNGDCGFPKDKIAAHSWLKKSAFFRWPGRINSYGFSLSTVFANSAPNKIEAMS